MPGRRLGRDHIRGGVYHWRVHGRFRPVRSLLVPLLAFAIGSCVAREKPITHLDVTVTFEERHGIDQLRFSLLDGTNPLTAPVVLPAVADGPLTSGETVAVLLADAVVGRTVTVVVVGMKAGVDVVSGEATGVPRAGKGTDVAVLLDQLVVTGPQLVSISVTPTNPQVPLGQTRTLRATGAYSDGTTMDLTDTVQWFSMDPNIAAVSDVAGSKGHVTTHQVGSATVTARSGAISGTTLVVVTSAVLAQIAVTPTSPKLASGSSRQLFATGIYSDGSSQDLTSSVQWTSSNAAAATVSVMPG
jgi:hypothetical protein